MDTLMPLDADGRPLNVLRLRPGGAHTLMVGATSTRNAVAFDRGTRVVSLYATGPCFVSFGAADVVAGSADHYFPFGIYYDIAIADAHGQGATHIAAVRADTDCRLYVSEKV
ncbi:hypothetical protein [Rhodocista pekingensis]|uniref:Uncharacterized protein n=1 Tax=Rhodocista pekingensis TaxID=201185 RepID=A0ABW2L0G0_9PROT